MIAVASGMAIALWIAHHLDDFEAIDDAVIGHKQPQDANRECE